MTTTETGFLIALLAAVIGGSWVTREANKKPRKGFFPPQEIVTKAMCLFVHQGKTLASKGFDDVANKHFYRVFGGTVDFLETGERAIRREIQEELQSDITDLRFLEVIENIFTYKGNSGHQIVFLYSGNLARKELYKQKTIHIVDGPQEFDAEWIAIEDVLAGRIHLYPEFDYRKYLPAKNNEQK